MRALLLERNTGTHLSRDIFLSNKLNLFLTGTQEHTPKDRCVPNEGTPFGEEHRNTTQKIYFFQKNLTCFNRNTGTPHLKTDVSQMKALLLDRNTGTHLRKEDFFKRT